VWIAAVVCLLASSCRSRELRGTVEASPDGQTYLAVEALNGSACETAAVDGKPWPHAPKVPGPIRPGTHRIDCGGSIDFEIRAGTTFRFDYWGP